MKSPNSPPVFAENEKKINILKKKKILEISFFTQKFSKSNQFLLSETTEASFNKKYLNDSQVIPENQQHLVNGQFV
jgi:hypothetical protein